MIIFVDGLLSSIQTIVACFRRPKGRGRLSYEKSVQYSLDEGESHGSKIVSLQVAKFVYTNPQDRVVQFVEPSTSNGLSVENGEQFYVTKNDSEPTDDLPSTNDMQSS